MTKRNPISKKLRFEEFKRDKFKCQYCGEDAPKVVLEVDHINPVANGGDNNIMNLVTSCFDCNRGKGSKNLSDDSEIHKQKHELNLLATRNEQLYMLQEWRNMLVTEKIDEADSIAKYWENCLGDRYSCSDYDRLKFREYISKFPFDLILKAIPIAIEVYMGKQFRDGEIMGYKWDMAIKKLGGITYNLTMERDNNGQEIYRHREVGR